MRNIFHFFKKKTEKPGVEYVPNLPDMPAPSEAAGTAMVDFITGELDISSFIERYRTNPDIADWLQSIVDYVIQYNVPPRRRFVTDVSGGEEREYLSHSTVEKFIPDSSGTYPRHEYIWESVRQYICYFEPHTIRGAFAIFTLVADIYYQYDFMMVDRTDKYENDYAFMLETIPRYVNSVDGEAYIQKMIIPRFPETMSKTARKQRIRAAIREDFTRECKQYPRWLQESEWPVGASGIPMVLSVKR